MLFLLKVNINIYEKVIFFFFFFFFLVVVVLLIDEILHSISRNKKILVGFFIVFLSATLRAESLESVCTVVKMSVSCKLSLILSS